MVYIFGTLGTLLLAYIAAHIDKSKYISNYWGHVLKCIFMGLSVLPLAIISAVRYGVGTDFYSYRRTYNRMNFGGVITERGFVLLLEGLHKISDHEQIFFIVTSFIFCMIYIYVIYKNSLNPVYSIFLFVVNGDYFMSMNTIRQAIAVAIILLALPYVKTRNWKRMLIIVFIASTFHMSAWFFVLFYLLATAEWKPIMYFNTVLATFILSNLVKVLIVPFLQKFTTYGRFFLETSTYVESNVDWVRFFIYMSFFAFMSYQYGIVRENANLKMMYSAVWMALVIVALGVAMPRNAIRVALYMNPIIAIYTPELTKCIANKQFRVVINFAIIFCYTIYCVYAINNGWHNAIPYQTFWN